MSTTMVAVDVGASRTRVFVGTDPSDFSHTRDPLIRDIRSAGALKELLRQVRSEIAPAGPVLLSAGVAAPAVDAGVRHMTNWQGDRTIATDELRDIGFDDVLLLNDLEASAHGLIAFLDSDPDPSLLVSFGGAPVPAEGNRGLVVPGSGLGSAGVVDLGPSSPDRWRVVPGEAGHTLASGAGADHVLAAVAERKGSPATWEDCVSGPGLEALWVAIEASHHDDPLSAPEISMRAAQGDERCRQALHFYYHFAARFSQVLALSFLSLGGLYLAGGSTRSNAPLISEQIFRSVFCDNERMGSVLGKIPVFLVLAEITLLGAWTAGWARVGRGDHAR